MRYEITARRIREAMSDMGISQQELADKAHIGKSSISHYVNGSNEPGNKSAFALAQVLKVNPAWLMGLDERKYLSENDSPQDREKEDMERFMELFRNYQNAIPEIREAVDRLLGFSQPHT